jgi:hypothetical protein
MEFPLSSLKEFAWAGIYCFPSALASYTDRDQSPCPQKDTAKRRKERPK